MKSLYTKKKNTNPVFESIPSVDTDEVKFLQSHTLTSLSLDYKVGCTGTWILIGTDG